MKARIRDTEIFFDIDGVALAPDGPRMRTKPTAFLVHGGPGSDHTDAKVGCAPLADKLQLIYFDHRGQGRSARGDPRKYTLDENVEDMEALRQYLGLGPIVSIGTSYGGMVAMAHAARYPAAVSHLILVVTASHAGYLLRAKELVAQRGTPEQMSQFEDLLAGRLDSPERLRRYFEVMGPLYSLKYDAALAKSGLERAILAPDAFTRAYMPGGFLRTFDLRPELRFITAPTLILAGRHDWICSPEFAEEIHAHLPGSDLRIFEESGHFIRADERQNFLDVVTGFLVYSTVTRGPAGALESGGLIRIGDH
jgi:proline iminopeptidase